MSGPTSSHRLQDSSSSLPDRESHLVGELNEDGTANLRVNKPHTSSHNGQPHSMRISLQEAANRRESSASESVASEDMSVEDYDAMKHDPETVVVGARGGGFETDRSSTVAGVNGMTVIEGEKTYMDIYSTSRSRPGPTRLKSIPVTLNKLREKGRYILTADDDSLREILKAGMERAKDPAKKRRSKFRDLAFTRQFTAFDGRNAASADTPFYGFFVLFWICVAVYTSQLFVANWQKHGSILGSNEIMRNFMNRDLIVLGLSDGVMCASTGFGLILQKLIQHGVITWNKEGWIIQSVWELAYITAVIEWTLFRDWPWNHTVFFVLHALVMLMKQHSYAFYNGHLSENLALRASLQKKLKQLEGIVPAQTPGMATPNVSSLMTDYLDHKPSAIELSQRRQSLHPTTDESTTNVTQVASAIDSGEPLDMDQIQTFERIMKWEIDASADDLKGKSTGSTKSYPNNLTVANHYEWILLPTLVYELEYPRSDTISWRYIAEKSVAVMGILLIMNLCSQEYIYPIVIRTIEMKEAGMPLIERLQSFPQILSDLIFPFMLEYMMTWYVIWECILNILAELTFFADRGFYADWWNSVSWDQFARDWNRPVHNFLLRHVYHSSISSLKVNKQVATIFTFFLSAIVHELVMWCLFHKLRGYLLFFQMLQLPLVSLSRTKFLKGKKTLGNIIFWVGIFTGPSLLCSLYLII